MTTIDRDAVYDRQMRLWGAAAQQKLSSSRVLVSGPLLGLGGELVKDLVLAGINVVLRDPAPMEKQDASTCVFLIHQDGEENVGKPRDVIALPRIKEMNPFADVSVASSTDVEDISQFALVVVVSPNLVSAENVEEQCRKQGVPFLACEASGMAGYILCSLGVHEYVYEKKDEKNPEVTLVEKAKVTYPSITALLNDKLVNLPTGRRRMPDGFFALRTLRTLHGRGVSTPITETDALREVKRLAIQDVQNTQNTQNAGFDEMEAARLLFALTSAVRFAPVCTIMGGLVGNEVIKILSGKDAPVDNALFFDGATGAATTKRFPVSSS